MTFLEKYKVVKQTKTTTNQKTFAERVEGYIEEQRSILNGEEILNQKGNQKSSWFNEKTNTVRIKIGIYPLLAGVIECDSKDTYKTILNDLSKWEQDADLKALMENIEKKMVETSKKRSKK